MIQTKISSLLGFKARTPPSSDEEYVPEADERRSEACSQWTRVKSLDNWRARTVQIFELEKDIAADRSTLQARHHLNDARGLCIFDPDSVKARGGTFNLRDYELGEQELQTFGQIATEIRTKFELDQQQLLQFRSNPTDATALEEVKRYVRLNRSKIKRHCTPCSEFAGNGCETGYRVTRRGVRKRHEMDSSDILAILSYWKVYQPSCAELGIKFRITRVLAQ